MDEPVDRIEPIVRVENVVASAALSHRLDLHEIVKNFPDVEYRPEQFPGLVFRLKDPKTATLIFGSGKMVCTGARSEKFAHKALQLVLKSLKKGGIVIKGKLEVKVVNIVASANLNGSIDLIALYGSEREMRGRILYEPEQFPGLIYRMQEPKVVFLLFTSGKLVCTGARKEEDVHKAIAILYDRLEQKELIYHEEEY
jgi:transcription initiation factor TFIID TATA-box-binding protein